MSKIKTFNLSSIHSGMRIVLIFLVISPLNVFATPLNIKGEAALLAINSLDGFKLYKDFLGLPYVMIEQNPRGKKTSISITPTGIAKMRLEDEYLESHYQQYKEGRRQWATKRKFKILSFLPFLSYQNRSRAKIVSGGYRYKKIDGTQNIERSLYILCPQETFQVKILTENNNKGRSFIKQLKLNLQGSRCE